MRKRAEGVPSRLVQAEQGERDVVLERVLPEQGDDLVGARNAEMRALVHRALHELQPAYRDVLLAREDATEPEVAAQLGISVANVKIRAHRAYLEDSGQLEARRARNLAGEVFSVASARAKQHLEHAVSGDPELERLLEAVQRRQLDPMTAVREILEKVFHIGDDKR